MPARKRCPFLNAELRSKTSRSVVFAQALQKHRVSQQEIHAEPDRKLEATRQSWVHFKTRSKYLNDTERSLSLAPHRQAWGGSGAPEAAKLYQLSYIFFNIPYN